jgi:hypothetical protein
VNIVLCDDNETFLNYFHNLLADAAAKLDWRCQYSTLYYRVVVFRAPLQASILTTPYKAAAITREPLVQETLSQFYAVRMTIKLHGCDLGRTKTARSTFMYKR